MEIFADEIDSCFIAPITDNLSSSYVDPSRLISKENNMNLYPVGMANFKSKKISPNPSYNKLSELTRTPPMTMAARPVPASSEPVAIKQMQIAMPPQAKTTVVPIQAAFMPAHMLRRAPNLAKLRWLNAASKIKLIKDPWSDFNINNYPAEKVVRHRYNPIKKQWHKDECLVRIETKQFAKGAMRACFRL
jgi:hypothetical protein